MWLALLICLLAACVSVEPGGTKAEETAAPAPVAETPSEPEEAPAEESGAPCTENGCVRSHRFVGRYTKAVIQPLLEPGVTIDNGYAVYVIRYTSDGQEVGATITVPIGVAAPAGGFHIVSNQHGTTGLADVCAVTGTTWGTGLAGEFGARGMIGVAPDYHGLGGAGVHPYLVTASEGRSALDSLRAAAAFADKMRIPISRRFAVVGLSQGGHAALAAAALHATYAKDLDVRAFAAAGPASVREELWRDAMTVPGEHVAYHALVFYAWAKHYPYAGPSPFQAPVAAKIDAWMETACAFGPIPGTPALGTLLPHEPAALFTPALLHGYATGEWGALAALHDAFEANRVRAYAQTAPLRIYQGDADATVPEPHTRAMVEDLRAGGVSVDYVVVPGGAHTDVAFSFVAQKQSHSEDAVAWLEAQLD
ncbi:MAG: hypothetical protein IT381_10600 [Deltaproteobacteria bacterium]|nr:hypothetical protein [Deltaproteobacteria bacterium]